MTFITILSDFVWFIGNRTWERHFGSYHRSFASQGIYMRPVVTYVLFLFRQAINFFWVLNFEICLSGTLGIGISYLIQFSTHKLPFPNLSYEPLDESFWRKCPDSEVYVTFQWIITSLLYLLWMLLRCMTCFRRFTLGKLYCFVVHMWTHRGE